MVARCYHSHFNIFVIATVGANEGIAVSRIYEEQLRWMLLDMAKKTLPIRA